MAMKLYYGGFGDYMEFTVAENEQDAIRNVGIKINAPFLPITVEEISVVDGLAISAGSETANAKTPSADIGDFSDGYHTFNELYHHRAVLFSVVCNDRNGLAWKSLHHNNPSEPMYDGMFIVGIETPNGQATYHYDIEPYWNMFDVPIFDLAPRWDGHTPNDAISRIGSLCKVEEVAKIVETTTEKTERHCKKCDFTCENQGELLAHYRDKHPKGD